MDRIRFFWGGRAGPGRCASTLLAGQGSNLQPPDSKSGVLPVELPAIGLTGTPVGQGSVQLTVAPIRSSRFDFSCEQGPAERRNGCRCWNRTKPDKAVLRSGNSAPILVSTVRDPVNLRDFMGSLIKKRRKRMRKKKHRKLLKRTRVQRRNKK